MAEQNPASEVDLYQVVRIVRSYVRHHQITPDQLVGLIVAVHRMLARLERGASPEREPLRPAVPIRRSVQAEYVVCLECGVRGRTLRRHLRAQHGLDVAQYRARWNLPADHPVTAPAYSNRRAAMAKAIGLGRRRRSPEPPAGPTRRRRPRHPGTTRQPGG